ncbi:DUF551 domain-containing protein [Citrobacter sp. Cf122]|uniref:DUF551 domain-containing protein n=1 Tax=Citrobacter sp. Cf122 TaxID=2985072 RepID=UPI002575D935|nr:DUF551 domain-containing protein [Citrobacter sp. Cf122]MDM3156628.1 DUF551 domain-containing protein [Citrobacter sp. Cf122]
MSTFTKEQFIEHLRSRIEHRKGLIASIHIDRGYRDYLKLELRSSEIALASLEAEAVAYMHHSGQVVTREECCDDKIFAICCKVETPLYAAPQLPQPAVLSVSEGVLKSLLPDVEKSEFWFEHNGKIFFDGVRFNNAVFEACRAAMLQAEPVSNHDELPLDYLQGHKDGLEWAAQLAESNHPQTGDWLYDDPIELAMAIRKGPDMPTAQAGNSPVTPDGWVACVERMPSAGEQVLAYRPDAPESNDPLIKMATYVGGSAHGHGFDCYCKPTHWMPLPAAPQQEVKP